MTNPTPEQIEAGAKAIYVEEENTSLSGYAFPKWDDLCTHEPATCTCESEGTKRPYLTLARAALVAAAGAAPRGDDLVERVADALAYYQCRETNPKADHPRMGYYAFSEDQRAHLRERKAEAAAEIARMMTAAGVTAHEPTLCAECNETEVLGSPAQQVLCMDCAYEHGRAGAAPQELSGNQAELIAEARSRAEHPGTGSNTAQCLRECADALEAAGNAPGQADEAKLGDLIAATIREVDGDHTMGAGALGEVIAGAVSERLRGGGR